MLDESTYPDDFVRRNLPPADLWPVIDADALAALGYPKRFNAAVELLDGGIARGFGDRPCLHSPQATWTYGELLDRANRIAALLIDELGLVQRLVGVAHGESRPLKGGVAVVVEDIDGHLASGGSPATH